MSKLSFKTVLQRLAVYKQAVPVEHSVTDKKRWVLMDYLVKQQVLENISSRTNNTELQENEEKDC